MFGKGQPERRMMRLLLYVIKRLVLIHRFRFGQEEKSEDKVAETSHVKADEDELVDQSFYPWKHGLKL